MRLDIRYETRFRYDLPVSESQNELRACPATDGRQTVLHYDVTTSPSSRVVSYVDHWGTRVDTFGVRLPHTHLDVVASATVETAVQQLITSAPRRSHVEEPTFRDRHLELLLPSPHTRWGRGITDAAQRAAEVAGDDLIGAVLSIHRAVGTRVEYVAGATYVGVDVESVLEGGRGVCQDFAHLAVAMYRSLGIPARYVSGYLFASDDATGDAPTDDEGDEVQVQTHAWVEVAIPVPPADGRPEGVVWFALDPTNQLEVGERHVTIGRGRDYDDVAPFRGVYAGRSDHGLEVSVTMRRLSADGAVAEGREGRGRDASLRTPGSSAQAASQQQ